MKANSDRLLALLFCCALALTPSLFAQATQSAPVPPLQDQPQPVYVTDPNQAPLIPDEQPLTGAQQIGYGSWGPRQSFISPSIRFAETLESNPLLLSNASDSYRGFTSFGADARLVQYFGRNAEIRYAGSMRYDTYAALQGLDKFTNAHDALISKRFVFRNWQLRFDNETQYSQASNFGAAGMEGMGGVVNQLWQWTGLSNVQLASNTLRPDIIPSQAIYSGRDGRLSNTSLGEADFRLNARDMITVAGTYSLLHFADNVFVDTRQASGIVGFNHNISPRDSVAVEAMYTHFTFVDQPTRMNAAELTLLYGRKITGKLSVDFGAGPVAERISEPNSTRVTNVDWQGRATLQYRMSRTNFTIRGARNFTAGAGVLDGAMTSSGEGSATFTLSRNWSSTARFGVSRNEQVSSPLVFDSQYAGIAFNRRLGLNISMYASYDFERQTTGSACVGPICQFGGDRNTFGIGLAWNGKPITIQ